MKRIIVFLALTTLLCSLALASVLHATTYEVAQQHPQASDDAPGTAERPWKTIAKAAVRQAVLRVDGDHVRVRGLHFRYAANMAQHGAVVLAGRHDTLEDCVIEAMNAEGATFTGEDAVVRRCTFRDNGQVGFGANGAHRLLFTQCLIENNNTKGFDRGWEAGGDKLVLCRDVVLEQSRFLRNRGSGIWFDIGNENCTVRNCLIAYNEDAGIFTRFRSDFVPTTTSSWATVSRRRRGRGARRRASRFPAARAASSNGT